MKQLQQQYNQQKYCSKDFSDQQLARDWTLAKEDKAEVGKYQPDYQAFIAAQIGALRLYGALLNNLINLSPRVINYINTQMNLLPSL